MPSWPTSPSVASSPSSGVSPPPRWLLRFARRVEGWHAAAQNARCCRQHPPGAVNSARMFHVKHSCARDAPIGLSRRDSCRPSLGVAPPGEPRPALALPSRATARVRTAAQKMFHVKHSCAESRLPDAPLILRLPRPRPASLSRTFSSATASPHSRPPPSHASANRASEPTPPRPRAPPPRPPPRDDGRYPPTDRKKKPPVKKKNTGAHT